MSESDESHSSAISTRSTASGSVKRSRSMPRVGGAKSSKKGAVYTNSHANKNKHANSVKSDIQHISSDDEEEVSSQDEMDVDSPPSKGNAVDHLRQEKECVSEK